MPIKEELTVRDLRHDSPHFHDAVRVYCRCWSKDFESSLKFFIRYAQAPGFVGISVWHERGILGFGFGTQNVIGNWWFDRVRRKLGDADPALNRSWGFIELATIPEVRRKGIGTVIHDEILNRVRFPRAILSTPVENKVAQRFYQVQGWRILATFPLTDDTERKSVIMGIELLLTKDTDRNSEL